MGSRTTTTRMGRSKDAMVRPQARRDGAANVRPPGGKREESRDKREERRENREERRGIMEEITQNREDIRGQRQERREKRSQERPQELPNEAARVPK